MSVPISACRASRVVVELRAGRTELYQKLVTDITSNIRRGHWSVFPCECEPRCYVPTDDELVAFNDRLSSDVQLRLESSDT